MYVSGLVVVHFNTLSVCTNLGGKTTSSECFLAKCAHDCVCLCTREVRLCMSNLFTVGLVFTAPPENNGTEQGRRS